MGASRKILLLFCLLCLFCLFCAAPALASEQGAEADAPAFAPTDTPLRNDPPPPLILCGQKMDESHKQEEVIPGVTFAMEAAAAGIPSLQQRAERHHACIGSKETTETAKKCESRKVVVGGKEVLVELEAVEFETEKAKQDFHKMVTPAKYLESRDRLAVASVTGFIRTINITKLLYRVHKDRKFHEDAEGVYMTTAAPLELEAARQEELKKDLEKVAKQIPAEDKISTENMKYYVERAGKNAKFLSMVACEMNRLAEKNREFENRQKQIMPNFALNRFGGFSGEKIEEKRDHGKSGITGLGGMSEGLGRARAQEEILEGFKLPERKTASVKTRDQAEDVTIFRIVHSKYREIDERGSFLQNIIE